MRERREDKDFHPQGPGSARCYSRVEDDVNVWFDSRLSH